MEPDKQGMPRPKEQVEVVKTVRRRHTKQDRLSVQISIPRQTAIIGGMVTILT